MKKIYYLVLLALPFLLQSCLKDDKEIFEEPASERLNATLKHHQEILMGATNGWMMEYYPEKTQKYGGYTLLMKFGEDDQVTIASELAKADKTETSMYQLIGDSGPILTFNTYNSMMHYFSDPRNPDGIGPGDSGMGGDYEFLVLEATAEKVTLKGKKTGNNIVMTPIANDAQWSEIIQEYAEAAEALQVSRYAFSVGNIEGSAKVSYRTFTVTYPGKNDVVEIELLSYRPVKGGIELYKPFKIDGKEITQMSIMIDEDGIVNLVDQASGFVMTETPPSLNMLLVANQWFFQRSLLNSNTQKYWDTGYNKLLAKGYDLYYAYMGIEPNFGLYGFCFGALIGNTYDATLLTYLYTLKGDNEITFKYEGRTTDIGIEFWNNGVGNIVSSIIGSKTFTITADNPKNPTVLTLTDVTNSDISFSLSKKEIYFPHYDE